MSLEHLIEVGGNVEKGFTRSIWPSLLLLKWFGEVCLNAPNPNLGIKLFESQHFAPNTLFIYSFNLIF